MILALSASPLSAGHRSDRERAGPLASSRWAPVDRRECTTPTISGNVVHDRGRPLAGAEVQAGSEGASSDERRAASSRSAISALRPSSSSSSKRKTVIRPASYMWATNAFQRLPRGPLNGNGGIGRLHATARSRGTRRSGSLEGRTGSRSARAARRDREALAHRAERGRSIRAARTLSMSRQSSRNARSRGTSVPMCT
jgi:hypothetical protein